MITGLDHVVLVTLDLAAAVAEWRGRGFSVRMGGTHAGGLSENALVGFSDGSYLERSPPGPAAARGPTDCVSRGASRACSHRSHSSSRT
ncbi:MAG TPA: VOC family protein [Candidatus Limnocylindria bacterium]|nr:VOC family protein [Candidatus Limnocylindria bacterium]